MQSLSATRMLLAHTVRNILHKQLFSLHNLSACTVQSNRSYHSHKAKMPTNGPHSKTQEHLHQDATQIFNKAIESVLPHKMVSNALHVENDFLRVDGKKYKLDKNVYVVGIGKAALGMVKEVEEQLGYHVVCGIASVPRGIQENFHSSGKENFLLKENTVIKVFEGAYRNLPDEDSLKASQEIEKLVQSLTKDDILLNCITGGGSALLSYPVAPVTLDDLLLVTKLIASHGGDINDLNTVRQNLEVLKAGGLARAAYPAQVISLLISDIIGDPLNYIASGPTVLSETSAKQCLDIFERYKVWDKVPKTVLKYLHDKLASQELKNESERTVGICKKSNEKCDYHVQNIIVGSNAIALAASVSEASERGYHSFIHKSDQEGEAREVATSFVEIANFICLAFESAVTSGASGELVKAELELVSHGMSKECLNQITRHVAHALNQGKPLCLVNGGETIVKVKGHGQGGRNTEFALAAAVKLKDAINKGAISKNFDILMLSAGTDGQDGSCDAAGAMADAFVLEESKVTALDANAFLEDNDSFTFFKQLSGGKYLVNTGLTGTNVMDVQLLLINRRGYMQKSDKPKSSL